MEEIFGNVFSKIESSKISVLHDIRQSISEYSTVSTRTGVEYEEISRTVSDSKWYNPFSWENLMKFLIPAPKDIPTLTPTTHLKIFVITPVQQVPLLKMVLLKVLIYQILDSNF